MATSSAMSTSNTHVKYTISITQNSQSVANNTSNVTVSVRFYRTNTGYTTYGNGTVYCKINGTQYSASVTPSQKITSSGIVLFTKTLNVSHGTDGKKTLTCSAWIDHNAPLTSSEQSYSQTLTTIPRKSTLSASNGTLGTAQTLSVTRQANGFTHTITYACGSSSGTVCTKSSSTSISWTPPVSLSSENTTGTTVSVNLTITTYSGSTSIGSNTKTINCAIPDSVKPTVSISVSDPTGNFSAFGAYVQSRSKMSIVLTETGAQGSTIKSRKITADGNIYTDATVTTGVISSTGNLVINATVTDTRGRTGTASVTISVLAYASPKVTAISAKRSDATGAASSSGAYLCVIFDSTVTALNNKNSAAYTVQYKKSGVAEYETATLSDYSGSYTVNGGTFVFPAETASSYDIILTVSDTFKDVQKTVSGPSISKLFSILAAGKGWAFGKIAELEGFLDIGWKTRFRKPITIDNDQPIYYKNPSGEDRSAITHNANNNLHFGVGGFDNEDSDSYYSGNKTYVRSKNGTYFTDSSVYLSKDMYFQNNQRIFGYDTSGKVKDVLNPCNSNGNLTLGYSNFSDKNGATNLYGYDIRFGVSNLAEPKTYIPYFSRGDSINVRIRTAGYVTGGGEDVSFFIPFSAPIIGDPNVTAESIEGFIFRQGSKYTHGSSATTAVSPKTYSVSGYSWNGVQITANFTNTTNVTNNDSIGVYWYGKITFS